MCPRAAWRSDCEAVSVEKIVTTRTPGVEACALFLVSAQPDAPVRSQTAITDSSVTGARNKKRLNMTYKILVVENDTAILEMLHEILTEEGYEVCMANDGDDLQTGLPFQPDLVLMDVFNPGDGGARMGENYLPPPQQPATSPSSS